MATVVFRASCQPEIERHLGCALSPEQAAELSRLVVERARKLRLEPVTYETRISSGELDDEALALAGHFTIGESYFFRDMAQLDVCCQLVLSRLREQQRPIKVLSAGCSTGEEPYSLLMLVHEQLGSTSGLDVTAVDINRAALERAKRARYSGWSLRETPEHLQQRWFRRDGRDYVLSPEISSRVTFASASLSVPSQALGRRSYDIILCRNVLMYFTPQMYHDAATRLLDALVPSGHLLLGHAESLRGLGLPAELIEVKDSFCYRKAAPPVFVPSDPLTSLLQAAPVSPATNVTGLEHGVAPPSWTEPAVHVDQTPAASWLLAHELATLHAVTALLESERFTEALQTLEAFPRGDSTVKRLCLALLLVYTNRFEQARAVAESLLNVETIAAEANYTLALCDEHSGDWARAAELARRATYLDPTFAMPWLHLGILSRKRGDGLTARRELLQARALLTVEPPERLIWFGGGCSRATLLAACQRELDATRGAA